MNPENEQAASASRMDFLSLPSDIIEYLVESDDSLPQVLAVTCRQMREMCEQSWVRRIRREFGKYGLQIATALKNSPNGDRYSYFVIWHQMHYDWFFFSPQSIHKWVCRRDYHTLEQCTPSQAGSGSWNLISDQAWGYTLSAANVHQLMLRMPVRLCPGRRYDVMLELTCRNVSSLTDIDVTVQGSGVGDFSMGRCPRAIQTNAINYLEYETAGLLRLCIAQFGIEQSESINEKIWPEVVIQLSDIGPKVTRKLALHYLWIQDHREVTFPVHNGWYIVPKDTQWQHATLKTKWRAENLAYAKQLVFGPLSDMRSMVIGGLSGM